MFLCEDVLSAIFATNGGMTEKVKLSMQTFLRKKEKHVSLLMLLMLTGTDGQKHPYFTADAVGL